ncbi:MAG: phosphoglycerate dehydrogenase [Clostridia bacterium]
MYKILITSRNFGAVSKADFNYFIDRGYEIVRNPFEGKLPTEEELISIIGDIDAVHIGNDNFNANILAHAKKLKVVNKAGIGVDNIDIDCASRLGIAVTNVPGTTANSVADLTFGLMLAVSKKIIYTYNRITQQGMWPVDRGNDIYGKTIGIIGLGRIGKNVALRAKGFGMNILSYEPYPDIAFVKENGITITDIDTLVSEADFVTLHIPKTPESTNIIDSRRLGIMKPSAILINAARGGLVNEEALYEALSTGKIAGAAFDVLTEEPPKSRPKLFDLDNFIITSHSGGNSIESIIQTSYVSAQNIIAILEGFDCPNFLNKDKIINKQSK